MNRVGGYKSMNWAPKEESAWDRIVAARIKRREMIASFRQDTQILAQGFQRAARMQIQGVGELAAYNVQTRMQAEIDARRKELDERFSRFDGLF